MAMRYKIGISFIVIITPLMIMVAILGGGSGSGGVMSQGLFIYSPFGGSGVDGALMFVLTILTSIIGGVLAGFILSPLYIFAHKNTIGRKMIYGIQEKSKSEVFKKAYAKAIFPGLMTLNLCLIFGADPTVQALVIKPALVGNNMAMMIAVAGLFPLMGGISMGIFSSVWFLQDGGIVYTNKEKVEGFSDPTEVKSLGSWYLYLLKGYAGISVIFSYYIFLSTLLSTMQGFGPESIVFLTIWPMMPLVIAFIFVPAMIALDVTFEKRRAYVITVAGKLGIKDKVKEPEFELIRD